MTALSSLLWCGGAANSDAATFHYKPVIRRRWAMAALLLVGAGDIYWYLALVTGATLQHQGSRA
jgi:hypothetical protein